MKKLKLQVQISVDGFIAGANGEMDWISWNSTEEFIQYVTDLTESCDTMLLGRKLADGFIPYWTDIATRPEDPQYSFARKMADTPKIVFSKTLDRSKWDNTELAENDLVTEIDQLKKRGGKDIIMYGGAEFASSVIKAGLIDEYHLFGQSRSCGKRYGHIPAARVCAETSTVKSYPVKKWDRSFVL